MTAALLRRNVRCCAIHQDQRRRIEVELFGLVLGKITDADLGRAANLAFHRLQALSQQLHEGGFAVAVGAQQRDAVVGVEAEVELAQIGLPGS